MEVKYWTMPGLAGSDSGHWQTNWEKQHPQDFERVEQENWDWPVMDVWTEKLQARLQEGTSPVVLIAHSLGCITLVCWSRKYFSSRVIGALLVAPADADLSKRLSFVEGFSPIPIEPLPFPSVVAASTNDIYMSIERAEHFAAAWGSDFVCVGEQGHINASSGLGDWPVGKKILADFTDKILGKTANKRNREGKNKFKSQRQ